MNTQASGAKQPRITVKAKIKSPTMTSEISGTVEDALEHMFTMLGDSGRRADMLTALQATHERCIAWEQERALAKAGA